MFGYTYQRNVQVSTFSNMKTDMQVVTFFGKGKSGDAEVLRKYRIFIDYLVYQIARNGEMQRLYFSFGLSVVSYEIV